MKIWTAAPEVLAAPPQFEAALKLLSGLERTRAAKLKRVEDQRSFVAAHALLRLALSRMLDQRPNGLEIGAEPKGRPILLGQDGMRSHLHLSLSHTVGCVAVAISDAAPIGVDVEAADRLEGDTVGFAARHFHPDELAAISALPAKEAARLAASIWCLKEAYGKARGEGLRIDTRATVFTVRERNVASVALPDPPGHAAWRFALFDVPPGHILAAAGAGDTETTEPVDAGAWFVAV